MRDTSRSPVGDTLMDRIDLKLLAALQADGGQTNQALADAVGLSASSCLRRVERLKADGVIRATVALVDPAALGRPLTAIIEVELERHGTALSDFLTLARAEPAATHVYAVTGESDAILILRLVDMEELNAFCDRLLRDDHYVSRFRTLFVMQTTKESTAIAPAPALSRKAAPDARTAATRRK